METLMNEENKWDHRISTTVKEGPADCTRIDEVVAALKKKKRQKVPATEDIETQWILDLCNGIVKGGCISEDWKSSVIIPIYKGKGIQ